jgi:hypothetical protein
LEKREDKRGTEREEKEEEDEDEEKKKLMRTMDL